MKEYKKDVNKISARKLVFIVVRQQYSLQVSSVAPTSKITIRSFHSSLFSSMTVIQLLAGIKSKVSPTCLLQFISSISPLFSPPHLWFVRLASALFRTFSPLQLRIAHSSIFALLLFSQSYPCAAQGIRGQARGMEARTASTPRRIMCHRGRCSLGLLANNI